MAAEDAVKAKRAKKVKKATPEAGVGDEEAEPKKATKITTPPAEATAEAKAEEAKGEEGKRKKGNSKKRKRVSDVPAEPETAQDQQRLMQREIQQLVVQLRKEGKSEQVIFRAKGDVKRKYDLKKIHLALAGEEQEPSKRSKKADAWKEKLSSDDWEKEKKENREKVHDIVVIPVLWRGRHDKLDVLGAAEDIKACIAQQGYDVWVDARRHYSPGQKFAHWEFRGVLLRVEVGPDDVQAGVCRLCKAITPGDYKTVERKTVRLPPRGARALLLALKDWGMDKIEVERRKGDSDEEHLDEEELKAEKKAEAETVPVQEKELQGNYTPHTPSKAATKAKKAGGKKKFAA